MVVEQQYQVCVRCIMDTSDPEIIFDDQGYCNHCHYFFERMKNEVPSRDVRDRTLSTIVERIKRSGSGKEYDCILGVSGGADSTTLAYYAKKLGLRPLAVHFDNGWNSELAVQNIKATLDHLGIDLYTYVVDWEEFKDLQLSFLKASVPNCEIPTDHAINALLFQAAQKYKVRYILGGGNVATEGILPKSWGHYNLDLKHLRALHSQFGTEKLKTLPQVSLKQLFYYIYLLRIRIIPLLNYIGYNKPKSMEILQNELGWRPYGSKHFESIYTRFFQGYILPHKFGFDKRRAHLSCLVCTGDIERKEALLEMEKDPYDGLPLDEDREFVCKKLGVSQSKFSALMASPAKQHTDYPSNYFILENFQKLKQSFKKYATSS